MQNPETVLSNKRALNLALFPAQRDAGDGSVISLDQARNLIAWAEGYDLDAWAGDVCFLDGKPQVTHLGAIINAKRGAGYYGYTVWRVPVSDARDLAYPEGAVVFKCQVYIEGYRNPIEDYGVVTLEERNTLRDRIAEGIRLSAKGGILTNQDLERQVFERLLYLPIARSPANQAQVRAIRRAHLKAYPLQRVSGAGS